MDIVKSMYADTIEERYSLIDDDDASGDDSFVDSVISQWMSRNCALHPDDFASMLELRGYDKKKYAKCIDGKSFLKGNKGNLSSWYSDFEKIFAFFSNSKFVEDINVGYVNIFMPFILYAEKTLRTTIPDSQMNSYDNVQNSIRGTLANRLLNIGLKTLVLEMRRENADGNLQGADGHERMLSFIHMASTYAYQRLLYSRYPVLARMLTQATTDYIAFIREMFTRLEESDSELKMFLKSTVPLVLSDIRLDGGDAHNHGRTVAILEFNNGSKVVYKPRDLSIHVLFADLAHECERSDDFLPLHVSRVLPEDGYAFEEFVRQSQCLTCDQVSRYYLRIGELLALVWFLHGNDMHYENIISDGEYPQIIDYETVCSNYVEMDSQNSLRETADVKVARRLRDSLAGTSFLPTRMVLNAEGESIDFSALNVKDQEVPTLFPVPVMLDTDGACFQKQHVVFSKKDNVLHYNDDVVNPSDYADEILDGFTRGVHALGRISDDALCRILQRGKATVRVLVRATSVYARFLNYMHHPKVLDDMTKIEAILENLYVFPYKNKHIFLSEYQQMIHGDIPMFATSLDSKILRDGEGRECGPSFAYSAIERIMRTKRHLHEEASLQESLIRNAFHMPVHQRQAISSSINEWPLMIGHYLVDQAILSDDGSTVSWICTKQSGESENDANAVGVPSPDLYDGCGGTAIFLASLSQAFGDRRCADYALKTMRSIQLRTSPSASESAFTGGLSQIYPALMLRSLGIKSDILTNSALQIMDRLERYVKDESVRLSKVGKANRFTYRMDYLAGASSVIILYLRIWELLRDDDILIQLSQLGRIVAKTACRLQREENANSDDSFPAGAGHGLEGISVALWRLYAAVGDTEFADDAQKIWEKAMAKHKAQPVRSSRERGKWCRGTVGLLWAQNEIDRCTACGRRFFDDAGKPFPEFSSVKQLIDSCDWVDDSLCHGRSGAIDVLVSLARNTNDERYSALARHLMDDMVAAASCNKHFDFGKVCAFPNMSVFLGPLGVAYAMLRVQNPDVPSLLSLEI